MSAIYSSIKKLTLASLICASSHCGFAQLNVTTIDSSLNHENKSMNTNVATRSVINEFAEALKPNSYNSRYLKQKKSYLKNAREASNASEMAKNIAELSTYIIPARFKAGTSSESIVKKAQSAKSMSDVSNLLATFETALKPEAFSAMWSMQKDEWKTEVKKMK